MQLSHLFDSHPFRSSLFSGTTVASGLISFAELLRNAPWPGIFAGLLSATSMLLHFYNVKQEQKQKAEAQRSLAAILERLVDQKQSDEPRPSRSQHL